MEKLGELLALAFAVKELTLGSSLGDMHLHDCPKARGRGKEILTPFLEHMVKNLPEGALR